MNKIAFFVLLFFIEIGGKNLLKQLRLWPFLSSSKGILKENPCFVIFNLNSKDQGPLDFCLVNVSVFFLAIDGTSSQIGISHLLEDYLFVKILLHFIVFRVFSRLVLSCSVTQIDSKFAFLLHWVFVFFQLTEIVFISGCSSYTCHFLFFLLSKLFIMKNTAVLLFSAFKLSEIYSKLWQFSNYHFFLSKIEKKNSSSFRSLIKSDNVFGGGQSWLSKHFWVMYESQGVHLVVWWLRILSFDVKVLCLTKGFVFSLNLFRPLFFSKWRCLVSQVDVTNKSSKR